MGHETKKVDLDSPDIVTHIDRQGVSIYNTRCVTKND